MIKRFILMALALAAVAGLFGYYNYVFKPTMIGKFLAANRPPPVPVAAVTAGLTSLPRYLTGIGTVQAVHQVTVAPEVAGRVVQISFEAGAIVKAGDPLIQLNDKPERGDLANYQAQAKLAELNLNRSKELVGRQFTPQQTVDQNQATLDQALAGIAKTQAVIAQKQIRAPFDGQLGIRQVDFGQYLAPGGTVVTLTNLDELFVNFTLPEQTRSQIAVGQAVRITVDAYPGRVFEARLSSVEPQISPDTRTIRLQAVLQNPEHLLLPGMFANVSVVLPPQPDVVTVPETAVDYSLYGDSVFVIRPDGSDGDGKPVFKAARTFVKTGDRFDNKTVVLSGITPGDLVAGSGQLKLVSGAVVTITNSDALKTPATLPNN